MRNLSAFALSALLAFPLAAQSARPVRPNQALGHAISADLAVRDAAARLAEEKKAYQRDIATLQRLRAADAALVDPVQPTNALQKTFEEVEAAKSLVTDFLARQGVIRISQELEAARRSPMSADFGRLRTILADDAVGPQTRVVTRNAARLQEETLAWIRVQESIAQHLRGLSEITGESLRASQ